MHVFLTNHREELVQRCRVKAGERAGRTPNASPADEGIAAFLDQVIRTLRIEQSANPLESRRVSGPAGGAPALSEVGTAAASHGKRLLDLGMGVHQVVHSYGDLCQSITDLAIECRAAFPVDQFRTLNRCLDNAISDAVTEYCFQRDLETGQACDNASNGRIDRFADELRTLLGTASLAFSSARTGKLGLDGATGSILERSLKGLEKLISASGDESDMVARNRTILGAYSLAHFIASLDAASSDAAEHGCLLVLQDVDPDLALSADRELLTSAIHDLLRYVFVRAPVGTEVRVMSYAAGDRILLDIAGGRAVEAAPVAAQRDIMEAGGLLSVRGLPELGRVLTITLARYQVPT
jgi:hypothetical protein